MSDRVTMPYVCTAHMPVVNNVCTSSVGTLYMTNLYHGTFYDRRSVFNCKFDSSEHHLFWCKSGKFVYYSDTEELTYILNKSQVALSEMINEQSFIFIYVGKPTQFVLYKNGNDCKTIETSKPIIGLRFHSDMLAVIQKYYILVFRYNENDNSFLDKITYYTDPNALGLCEFKNKVIVFPETKEKGALRIINTQDNTEKKLQLQQSSKIVCLALNQSGDLLAISFFDIPIIYIWSIIKDKQIFILQTHTRMTKEIFHINFSADSKLACCLTINGQINVFNTNVSELEDVDDSDFREKIIKGFANFTMPLRQPGICTFLTDNTIQMICISDNFYLFKYPIEVISPSVLQQSG